ncbi:MAG: hypothetical protein Q8N76_08225, partial [Candidatus Omnitrophota bacterium]|nr:hypothetical protein [Candidatus Omnitrophota bacterium]
DRTNLALAYMDEYTRRPDPDILEKALKQCDIALKTDNSPSIPHAIKGYIYNLQGARLEDAVLELKKALIHENRSPFLYNEISGIYYKSENYSRALFFIDRALVLFPGNKIFEKNKSLIADKI